jgi:hypothetical protein
MFAYTCDGTLVQASNGARQDGLTWIKKEKTNWKNRELRRSSAPLPSRNVIRGPDLAPGPHSKQTSQTAKEALHLQIRPQSYIPSLSLRARRRVVKKDWGLPRTQLKVAPRCLLDSANRAYVLLPDFKTSSLWQLELALSARCPQ